MSIIFVHVLVSRIIISIKGERYMANIFKGAVELPVFNSSQFRRVSLHAIGRERYFRCEMGDTLKSKPVSHFKHVS